MNKKVAFCLIIILLSTNFATATIRNVNTGISYPTIQAAINAAIDGEEISVTDGTYTGPGNRNLDFGGKAISIYSISGNPAACIIDCNGLGRAFYFHNGETPAALVQGFTIKNSDEYYGGAIECEEASPTIDNCIIINNTAAYGGAIDCFYASPVITNCIIAGNASNYDGGAIECSSESSPAIRNCLILNSMTGGYGAIDCFDDSSPAIINCTIVGNNGDATLGGIYATDISIPTIQNCILWNNGDDIYGATDVNYSCIQDGDVGTGHNISTDPMFRKGPYPSYGNYYLSQTAAGQLADSDCNDAGSDTADAIFGLDPFTTRTDNVPDSGTVDMGFHYPDSGIDVNYVLITGVEPNENFGTIDPNYPAPADPNLPDPNQLYKQFSEVSIDANPAPNYRLENWTIDSNVVNDVNTTRVVTMDANHTVKVRFASTVCKLVTYVVSGNGTIYPDFPPDGNTFPKNSLIEIHAYPTDPNFYGVDRWLRGATETFDINDPTTYWVTNGPTTAHLVSLNMDTTVAVEFGRYLLDTRVDGGGGTISPRRGYQPARKTVQLTATPDSGYRVKGWSGTNDDNSVSLTNAVTMTSAKTVTVKFEAIPQYLLTVNINDPNLGSVEPNSGWYDVNTIVTLTAIPAEGYRVRSWSGAANNQPAWNVNTNTVTMDANNKTVTVTFELNYSRVIHVFGDIMGIQKAIDDANNGDTIQIHPGTYLGGLGLSISKSITIVGDPEHPENVVIDFNSQERYNGCLPLRTGFDLYGANCTLNGVTIINVHSRSPTCHWITPHPGDTPPSTYNNYCGAVRIVGNATIKNCIIRDCSIEIEPALDGYGGGDPNIGENQSGGAGGSGGTAGGVGIYVEWGDPNIMNVLIEDCCAIGGDAGDGNVGFFNPDPCAPYFPPGTNGSGGWGSSVLGTAIYIAGGNPRLTDVTVINCIARAGNGGNGSNAIPLGVVPNDGGNGGLPGSIEGAGIYCAGGVSPVFVNCIVENCIGYGGKGGNGGNGGISDDNDTYGGYGGLTTDPGASQGDIRTYTTKGGAVSCGTSSAARFTNCNFTGNRIYGSISGIGGISRVHGAEVPREPRKNYRLAGLGAGAFCSTASNVKFNGCYFEDNRTAYNQDYNEPNITDYNGVYTGSGGGLCLWYTYSTNINECNFVLNSAPIGGGIYGEGSEIHVRNCTITNNISMAGGGVLALDSVGTINKSIIKGNIAGTQTGYYTDTGYPLFGTGGGIYALSSLIDINDTYVTENYARLTGAGICFDGDTPFIQIPHIKNCLVTRNRAAEQGGGIAAIYFAEPKIQNCTITENTVTDVNSSGGGLFASYAANVNVKDTIFWANSGIYGSQIALSNGGPFTNMPSNLIITYSDIDLRKGVDFNSLEFESGAGSGSGTTALLVDGQTIYNEINSSGSAKVIVSLAEPAEMRAITNWFSPVSVNALQSEIATRQNQVLSTLNAQEFTLRHKLANIAVFSGQITQAGLDKLLSNPLVAHIEPVRTVHPMLAQAIPLANALETRPIYNGQGVSIAIIDSGVDYTHPRLGGGAFPNSKVIGGYDTGDNDSNPIPVNEAHGTCCAGIAAGLLGTVGDYIGGVAYNAKIYALKIVTDAGQWPTDSTVAAWDWCITHRNNNPANPIRAMSNSWGIPGYPINNSQEADAYSPAHTTAAQTAVAAGITIFAASGNDGFAGQGISWPSAMSNVISVGAVYDTTDQVTPYSNTAENLDILAPADPIYTTDIAGPPGYDPGDYFPYFNGTSASCPFATGCAAALQSAAIANTGAPLSPQIVRGILKMTGDPVTDTKVAITKPRVNLGSAIALLTQSVPIYAEEGCTIIGLEKDANGTWIVSKLPIDSNNISKDPNFVSGYYLSYVPAGQDFNSPCIDIGSTTAAALGLNTYTTRVDGVFDSNIVDLGYHYRFGVPQFDITVKILQDSDYPGIHGRITAEPNKLISYDANNATYKFRFYAGTTPNLTAVPDANYYVRGWYDKYNTSISVNNTFSFPVEANAPYFVRFKPARTTSVSGGGAALRNAVNTAENGDTLIVAAGTYSGSINISGKQIKLYGVNPDDPNVVARTIIDAAGSGQGFVFSGGENNNTVIDGFTIINGGGDAIQGGAIFIDANSSPLIVNVDISDCNVTNASGGAIYIGSASSPEFRNVNITNCSATMNGGGVYISNNSSPIFKDCSIANCNAGINGGAVYCRTLSNPQFINCSFTNNSAADSAGAIFYDTSCTVKLNSCVFAGNTASEDGGAVICSTSCVIDINNCDVANNNSGNYAGGIYIDQDCDGKIHNTKMTGNAAFEDGGAIYIIDSNVIEIADCNIIENTALRGGGIFVLASPRVTITGCRINANEAYRLVTYTDPNDPNTTIVDDDFVGQGGGIYAFASIEKVANCQITGNTANTSGGGIYIAGEQQDANYPLIKNCLIAKNESGRDGGGISSNWFAATKVTNCTIVENSTNPAGFSMANGAGLYCSYGSVTEVNNSIIWGNMANDGSQIAVGSGDAGYPLPSSVNVTYSDIHIPEQAAVQALDVVICIDTTGSMSYALDSVKNAAADIVAKIAGNTSDYRIAVVDYRDFPIAPYGAPGIDYPYHDDSRFTSNSAALQTAIQAITLGAGGDREESVYSALMHCIDGSSLGGWRTTNTKKLIILMGDAPPHDPEPTTSYRLEDVVTAATNKNINIFSILTGSGVGEPTATYYFRNLADDTGGIMFETPDGSRASDAVMQAIDLATRVAAPIYVEPNCALDYWNSATGWDDVNSHNIHKDPNFVLGYYLSHKDAGQDYNSPCFDIGLGTAQSLGLNIFTTRTDDFSDTNIVDLGYHYPAGVNRYGLRIDVNNLSDANGTIEAPWEPNNTYLVYENTMVRLHAIPDVNSRVAMWIVDDVSIQTHEHYYNVIMDRAHNVTVVFEFYPPKNLIVPDEYEDIQDAIDAAENGDTIYIYRKPNGQPHYITEADGLDFKGKAITIRSENPDDPNVVAQTVIDCNNRGRAFIFQNEEDVNSIIEGLTIINCLAGGAIAPPAQISFDPCDSNIYYFNGNDATGDGYGGAIYCNINTRPIIRNCVFINCQATGGIGSDGGNGFNLLPDDQRERGGTGGYGGSGFGNGYGGAIFCDQNSSPTILACTISNCAARGGLGGDGGNGGNGTTSKLGGDGGNGGNGSGFGYGGAIYVAAGANPKITRCNFFENATSQGLGGIGGRQGAGQIPDEPPFPRDGSNGASTGAGFAGAIYYETDATVDINDCNFINNTTEADTSDTYDTGGGAIYCEPSCDGITILKANIAGNRTTRGSGGAIWFSTNNNITLTDCYFGGNTANDDGGALVIGQEADANMCTLDFNNCAFTDNIAGSRGGAIIARNFDATFVDCYINRNTAASGGGLYLISEKSIAKIHGGTIMNNRATGTNAEGGGAYISNLPLEIINCQLIGNISPYSGGGIMFKGPGTTTSRIHNCLFAKNNAGARGGALLVSLQSSPTITSCSFSENGTEPGGAGGAILCAYGSSPIIKDCIFNQTKRIAIYESSTDSDPTISYCLFYDNFDGDFYDRDSGITYKTLDTNNPDVNLAALNIATDGNNVTGSGNNPLTPLFVTGNLGKYYLSQSIPSAPDTINSPAINAGSANANTISVLAGETMADYTTRIDSDDANVNAGDAGQLDIGFHYIDIDIEANRPRRFELITAVHGGHGDIEPSSGQYYAGTTVELTALPDPGWRVNKWTGTDDDSSTNTTNYVVMIRNRTVSVSFEQPRDLHVPGQYTSLQSAINNAKSGDKIILAKGTYFGHESGLDVLGGRPVYYINGKNITITGTNPDDPCIVAQTILDGARFFIINVDKTMVIDGLTIQNANWYAGDVDCDPAADTPTGDGPNGGSIFGGAIEMHSASLIIRNCRFVNCTATASNGCNGTGDRGDGGWAGWAWGGAAAIDSTSNPVFKNCQFINCAVYGSNGGNGATNGHGGNWGDPNGSVSHSWDWADGLGPNGGYADYWYYSGYGGAIYCMSGSKPEFEKCLFQGNRSYGGVCGVSGDGPYVPEGWPSLNYAIDSFGGAVYLAAGSEANFTGCNFTDNEADTRNQVGPNDANYSTAFVLYSPVISYGGAVSAEGTAIPVFKNCTFSNNRACAGGGMYWENSSAHISRCTFEDCVSMFGGAMSLADSNSIIFECDFSDNQAIEPVGQGGAIYCASSAAKFYDCEISNNQASTSGGGAYFSGELEPNMHNCLIIHNDAGRDGGGVSANWDARLTLSNCTIAHNAITGGGFASGFGGGLSCAYEADTNVINSIIWSNNAQYGSEISIGSNFDAADKLRAKVSVSYSDVRGGAAGVFVDDEHGCILNWDDASNLSGTTLESPIFVTGYWGDYYLSQIDTNDPLQTADSPCVDAGFGWAINNDMYRHTTRTDHVLDIADSNVDMGYHYTLTAEILGDFNFDGIVDINDFILFEQYWMDSGCVFPYFCHERDITEDGEVDFEDFAAFAANYGETETTPPQPDPMTWATRPRSAGLTEITMAATTARDNSGSPIEYYLDCVSGGNCAPDNSNHDRNWDPCSAYTDTGLTTGAQYGYRVKAKDERGNETRWSVIAYAVPGEDDNPPQPNPMTWATAPYPTSPYSIRMVSTTATDVCAVEYHFIETSGNPGATNSDWQSSPVYEDFDLQPNTIYTYQVKARDTSPAQNETDFSAPASATTPPIGGPNEPNDTEPPTPNPSQWASVPQSINPGGPFWYHYMTAVTATDASPPVEYYFECVSGGGTSSGWITSPTYQAGPFLTENHAAYRVYTRDARGNVGSPSPIYHTYYGYIP